MKILYVAMDNAHYGPPGSLSRSHEVLVAEYMANAGHEVTLVTERQPGWSAQSPQPKSLELRVMPVNKPSMAESIGRALPGDFDAAFASSASGATVLAAWKKRHPSSPAVTGTHVVTQCLDLPLWRLQLRGGPWFEGWRPWFNGLLEMDSVVVNTKQTQSDLLAAAKLYKCDESKLPPSRVVYYGIDTDVADQAEAVNLNEGSSEPLSWCVSASRLVPYKGLDLGIAALSLFPPEARPAFAIIGDGEDAERLLHVAALSDTSVAFTGGIGDLEKFQVIKGSTIGLFLAFNRHIPAQFPMECVYAGHPCLVADIPINRERFSDHGVTYVNPFNTQEVAEGVRFLLDYVQEKPAQWVQELKEHRKWIQENRSFKSHATEILSVLEKGA